MEKTNSKQTEPLLNLLASLVEVNHAVIVECYLSALQETVFSNRAEVRPSMLKQIASDEAEMLLSYLKQPMFSVAERGSQLHQAGLSETVVLRLGHVTRLFFLSRLESNQIAQMLETVHAYQEAVFHGFAQGFEQFHLREMERTRNSFQRSNS
ncbi:MAG TPA: hypothetical protein VFI68_06780 [Anaerolineales bacterium]|nr:hypothetical protein [Anaerolineales bacterium]